MSCLEAATGGKSNMSRFKALSSPAVAVLAFAAASAARADVTVQEQSSFDVAVIKMHGTSTEYTTADKQRRDSDMHCEGFMSMLCGNVATGHIVRLDRDLEWQLEPKKKEYRENPIPTAAQRRAAQEQAQAALEKLKQCPAVQQQNPAQQAPDTSKCEMSPPKFDIKQPGTHATFAGHDTQLTQLALTQSCTNKETGDTCDFMFLFDSWLTQEPLAGEDDRKAFELAYAKKLGLDDLTAGGASTTPAQVRQFLAPYAGALKELGSKASALKGFPLKTTVRIAFGGEHCAAAKNNGQSAGAAGNASPSDGSAQSAGASAASSAAGGGSILGSAASAFGSKLGGMLAKRNSSASSASATDAAASPLPPGMIQAASFSTETTAITQGSIPASQFEIPAGWKLVQPPPAKEREFSCPKSGS
jgi:hypothetical protein